MAKQKEDLTKLLKDLKIRARKLQVTASGQRQYYAKLL